MMDISTSQAQVLDNQNITFSYHQVPVPLRYLSFKVFLHFVDSLNIISFFEESTQVTTTI